MKNMILGGYRISIPKNIREKLNLQIGDNISIVERDGEIIISPEKLRCAICESITTDGAYIYNKTVCPQCLRKLR